MIYFGSTDRFIKLGYSSADNFQKRLAQHRRNWESTNWKVLAVMQGDEVTEEKLKRSFSQFRWSTSTEEFEKDSPVSSYVLTLLERGWATNDPLRIDECPSVPFSAIDPDSMPLCACEPDGQISLFRDLPVEERIALLSPSLPQNHSFSDEWYTPEEWIVAARAAMGSIDTDPATSVHVNAKFIRAATFYTKETNGLDLTRPWHGNVWLNPPYGKGDNSAGVFIERLAKELDCGNVRQAITCLNLASMSAKWFFSYIPQRTAVHCIAHGRPNFTAPDDKPSDSSPTKGTVFSYFGQNQQRFIQAFGQKGQLLMPCAYQALEHSA